MNHEIRMNRLSAQIGFWSAALSVLTLVVYTVCFGFLVTMNPLFMWTNLADYVAYVDQYRSPWPDMARFAIVILAALWVVMLNAVHDYARDEHKILARISLAFGLAFAVLTGAFYFVQISAVRLSLLKGDVAGLEQIVQANPYSALAAMNMLAWSLFLGLASLFAAPIFSGGRVERVLRIAFVLNGIFCLLSIVGYLFEIVVLLFITVNLGTGSALLVITIGLSLLFRKLGWAAG